MFLCSTNRKCSKLPHPLIYYHTVIYCTVCLRYSSKLWNVCWLWVCILRYRPYITSVSDLQHHPVEQQYKNPDFIPLYLINSRIRNVTGIYCRKELKWKVAMHETIVWTILSFAAEELGIHLNYRYVNQPPTTGKDEILENPSETPDPIVTLVNKFCALRLYS